MTQVTLKDGNAVNFTADVNPNGRAAAAASAPVVLASEDNALLTAANTARGAAGDIAYADGTGASPGSLVALLKGLFVRLSATLKVDTVVQSNAVAPAATTIATGGTAQTLFAANPTRRGMAIQNQSSGDLYIATAAALNQSSLRITPGAYYEVPAGHTGTALIQVIGATTGQPFWAREW